MTGTLRVNQCTFFLIISRQILLRMRNVSDQTCRENPNTHFMFNNMCSKILPFMSSCGKNTVSRTGHNENMVHAHCVLYT